VSINGDGVRVRQVRQDDGAAEAPGRFGGSHVDQLVPREVEHAEWERMEVQATEQHHVEADLRRERLEVDVPPEVAGRVSGQLAEDPA
jgi:hypothetical protein